MLNSEKYTTAEERAKAFDKWCKEYHEQNYDCTKCRLYMTMISAKTGTVCPIAWLDLEAEEEKPLPCPFCGGESLRLRYVEREGYAVLCGCCRYKTPAYESEAKAIAAHNRVARAVMQAGMKEEK